MWPLRQAATINTVTKSGTNNVTLRSFTMIATRPGAVMLRSIPGATQFLPACSITAPLKPEGVERNQFGGDIDGLAHGNRMSGIFSGDGVIRHLSGDAIPEWSGNVCQTFTATGTGS